MLSIFQLLKAFEKHGADPPPCIAWLHKSIPFPFLEMTLGNGEEKMFNLSCL